MEIKTYTKESFSVIGKEGSTMDGDAFVERLWDDANTHFNEVEGLAKTDENGHILGVWGAMSDVTHSFKPWEDNFTKGLYLAGIEVNDTAEAPEGWVKWTIPSYEYIYVKSEGLDTFKEVIAYLKQKGITLAGAVHDFKCPEENQWYMFFPIRKL